MSCIRANIPITIVEGGTFDKTFRWATGDPAVPVDLSGYTAHMQIRAKLKDDTVLLDVPMAEVPWEADGVTGVYLYDGVANPDDLGKWRIYLKNDDTEGLTGDKHKDMEAVYDLFLYNAEEEAVFQLYGVATLIASVTRDV